MFLLNAYVCRGLFGVEYLRQMGSIECLYIGMSRYMLAHWRDLSWFPVWYAGIPAQNTYPPLLHWIVSLVALLRGISPAHALSLGHGAFLLPRTCYAVRADAPAQWIATGGFPGGGSLFRALSPSEWLMPAIGRATGQFHPERLTALVYYGEGPHVTALTLLPLAILLLDLALERKRAPYFALAALTFASVALTNWLGALGLALGVVAYVLAKRIPSKLWCETLPSSSFSR